MRAVSGTVGPMSFLIVCVLFQGSALPTRGDDLPTQKQIVLRFDGVYQSEQAKDNDHCHYVRFYDDGSVITVSSSGTPEQIKKWFERKQSEVSRGTYTITGTRIVFSGASKQGVVDYDGRIKGDTIDVRVFSHINQHRGSHALKFVELEFPAE